MCKIKLLLLLNLFFIKFSLATEFDHVFVKSDFVLENVDDPDTTTNIQTGNRFKIVESDDLGQVIQFDHSPALFFLPSIYSQTYRHDPELKINPQEAAPAYFSVSNPDAVPAFYALLRPGESAPPPLSVQHSDRVKVISIHEDSYQIEYKDRRYIAYNSEATPETWLEDSDSFAKSTEILDLNKSLAQKGNEFVWKTDDIPPGIDPSIPLQKGDTLIRENPKKDEWGYFFHLKSDPKHRLQLSRKYVGDFVEAKEASESTDSAKHPPPQPKEKKEESPHKVKKPPAEEESSDAPPTLLGSSRDENFAKVLNYYDHIVSIMPEKFKTDAERVCSAGGCKSSRPKKCMNSGTYRELMSWLRENLLHKKNPPDPLFPWGASGIYSLMMTAYGEARGLTDQKKPSLDDPMTRANMLAIMKVIQNRKTKVGSNATLMKVATQDRQFSMWNRTDPNFACMIIGKDRTSVQRAASAYLDFVGGQVKYSGGMEASNVYHYHTNYVSPDWGQSSKKLSSAKVFVPPPPPDGTWISLATKSGKGVNHRFYKDIRWSYANKYFGQ